jgi:leader peptidase (prepilin peptidase) / N-methyltransferase
MTPTLIPELQIPVLVFVTVFGLIWGSFFNVLILRIPARMSLLPRSRCANCLNPVPWYFNVPVFSYLWLRGKCHNCGQRISIQYPLIEIATAVLFLWIFLQFGLSWRVVAYGIFLSLLLVISVIDLYHQIIPDELSLPGIVLGVIATLCLGEMEWWESVAGILVGGGLFYSIATLYEKVTHREGLGGGDVKLLALIGAWLGVKSILTVVVLSSLLGSIVGIGIMILKRKDFKSAIPFGPFLALAAVIDLFCGQDLSTLLFPEMGK